MEPDQPAPPSDEYRDHYPVEPRSTRGRQTVLVVIGSLAAVVLVVGLVLWLGSSGDDVVVSPSPSPTGSLTPDTATPPATAAPPTDPGVEPTTPTTPATSPTTTPPTTPATEPPPSAPPPPTTNPPPSGDRWTASSPYLPEPIELARATTVDGLAVYDGTAPLGDSRVRCVAVTADGAGDGWREWCGAPGVAHHLLFVDGIDPWSVQLGVEPGDVTLTRTDPTWTLATNGCRAPVATLLGTAGLRVQMANGLVCAGDEAFVRFGSVLLQEGGADGGGVLLAEGDEGWNLLDGGTSIDCAGWPDGVDRCELFDVTSELFGAVLPIPPTGVLTDDPTQPSAIVAVADETATVRGWVGGATDPDAITDAIVAQLVDPDAEVPATVTATEVRDRRLVVVVVPALDDAVASGTWAVWIDAERVVRATTWQTCARGISGGLCV